jgi:Ca2+-binding RTX toxin-like protein
MPIARSTRLLASGTTSGTQIDVDTAALDGGRFVVIFRSGQTTMRIFEADGTAVGAPISTSPLSGSGPVVAALGNGQFVAVASATASTGADVSGTSIRAQLFDSNGATVVSTFVVNTTTANNQSQPSIGVLTTGQFVVAWSDDGATADAINTSINARIYNADGTAASAEFKVNAGSPSNLAASAITPLANGQFLVSYTLSPAGQLNERDVVGRIFNANGTAASAEFRINTVTTGQQQDVELATLTDGRFVAVYQSNATFGASAKVFNANGTVSIAEFQVNQTPDGLNFNVDVAALADGRFVITHTSSTSQTVRATVYNSDGTVSVPEFEVEAVQWPFAKSSITALADGRFVVAVSDSDDSTDYPVTAHIFDPRINTGSAAADVISGATLGDTLSGLGGSDTLNGLAGDDVLIGGAGADRLDGGAGTDGASYLTSAARVAVNLATGDGFEADAAGDTLIGIENVTASAFNDSLVGSTAANVLDGVDGNDLIYGNLGNDTILGGAGDDLVFGEQDNDLIYGFFGLDTLWGGGGNDTLWGEANNDALFGEDGNDILLGDDGEDTLFGWNGSDTLYGWTGNDVLWGEQNADRLLGEAGNDTFIGGIGRDTMTGGAGADRFYNASFEMVAGETDIVTDYDSADRYLFQTGANIQYVTFNAPGYGFGAAFHVQVGGGVFILDVMGATTAQLQSQTLFF